MRAKRVYKILSVCLAAFFLALTGFAEAREGDQRNYTSKWTPKRNVVSIDVGGLLSLVQVGYDYEYTDTIFGEQMTVTDIVENSEALGFSAGAGFYVMEYLEISACMNIFSKSLQGRYGQSLPNVYSWIVNDIASDEKAANPVFKKTVFHFVVNFHPITSGNVRPFFGAGISFISGKMDLLKNIVYEEIFFSDYTHEIRITEIKFVETDISKSNVDSMLEKDNSMGFNFTGGMDIYITKSLAFYASGRYVIAKREFEHPYTTKWEEGETIELDLGGLSANLGIKVFF
jgi:hypothetical protein